jgi:N4-(beta-N-acetylglucosaminyl)-L-asparaginase
VLAAGGSAVDAVVAGATAAERDPAAESVGRGAHPDAAGEVTLDAMVMNGDTARVGAVGALRGVANAAQAALLVLRHSAHSMLVGSQASDFAVAFGGFPLEPLQSNASDAAFAAWTTGGCQARTKLLGGRLLRAAHAAPRAPQPNYWLDTAPPAASGCGPFRPQDAARSLRGGSEASRVAVAKITPAMHDTVSLAALDAGGSMASATSTNGLAFKLPGRVGDGAIAGGGSYSRSGVGACGATGDGDVMAPFLPCYQVVESMRLGMSPQQAAEDAILRIAALAPHFTGALFALRADGKHAGAAYNWVFQYTVRAQGDDKARVFTVQPLSNAAVLRHRAQRIGPAPALLGAAFLAGAACAWALAEHQRSQERAAAAASKLAPDCLAAAGSTTC